MEGALWNLVEIDALRVKEAVELQRVVTAIDPSGSSEEGASEQGIITAGIGMCDCKGGTLELHGFMLSDVSGHYTPDGWARAAIGALDAEDGDRIVAEANYGGDMVQSTLKSVDPHLPYKAVHASRGKVVRAEPIAALAEQGKIHHVGVFPKLEEQLTRWTVDEKSPDRLDAYVWAFTDLFARKKTIVAY